MPRTLAKVCCGGWVVGGGWSKGILEFRFGPILGLRLEAWTKLNNGCKIIDKNTQVVYEHDQDGKKNGRMV